MKKRLQLSIYYLQELNYRLAYTAFGTLLVFYTTYHYKQSIIFIILPQGLSHLVSTGLTETFFTYIELCSTLSFSFSLILILTQIYLFLRPGLYIYETKITQSIFIGGIFFYTCLYVFILPWLIKILWELFSEYSKNFTPIHLTFEPRIKDYLDYIKDLNKILSFSFPLLLGLNIIQRYTPKDLWVKYRGTTYIMAFFIAALITPPDILSQIIIGLPLILFYEIQIIFWSTYTAYQKKILIWKPIKSHQNTLGNKK
uniref:Sec-independent transporter protein n=1 Tax=Cladosiphon okamuranus TaxID=309737 RepID=A0A3G5FPN1_9PHAE|nr:Sec-independent transporter protein [Cladosiphon okamuranus]AYW52587.1 Sec-independent transporter protein [Cladosiphon okamuranus]